jgi:sulfopyruvate decarboxylase subunit alpha
LIISGKLPLTIIQNQGFLACTNAVRGAGLEAGLPIVSMIGQFGWEDESQGQDPATSARRVVRLMEPMLDVMGMKCLKLDAPGDEEQIPDFFQIAVNTMSPAAILVGARTAWDA